MLSGPKRQSARILISRATTGAPESREYMLRGMLKDDEIGIDSDVARIAWSGA
jgi:hypothetical protein